MSFGKRKFEDNRKKNTRDYDNYTRASFSPVQIALSLAGIFVVSAIVFTGTFFMARAGYLDGGPSQTVLEGYFDTEPAPVARNYAENAVVNNAAVADVRAIVKINVARSDTGFNAIDSELHEQCLKPLLPGAADQVFSQGYFNASPENSIEYLTCTMRIYKSRFCDGNYRERLAERISETIRFYHEEMKRQPRTATASNANQHNLITPAMAAELGNLSVYGLIGVDDFETTFRSAPAEVLPYLRAQEYQVCS